MEVERSEKGRAGSFLRMELFARLFGARDFSERGRERESKRTGPEARMAIDPLWVRLSTRLSGLMERPREDVGGGKGAESRDESFSTDPRRIRGPR